MDAQKDIPVMKFDKAPKDNKQMIEAKMNEDLNATKEDLIEIKGDPKCKWCWGRGFVRLVSGGKIVTQTCRCVRQAERKLEQKKFEAELAIATEKKKRGKIIDKKQEEMSCEEEKCE